ncbi:hypothetical protein Q8F55_001968 [Vanrija albida]|uniref:Ubiquitin-like domain-containing protein n=1 Tax=Vanrija albida TaxID=181172 RepID=A0ABR3Q8G0_9TREE
MQGEPPGPIQAAPPPLAPYQAQPAATDSGLRHRQPRPRKQLNIVIPTAEHGGETPPAVLSGGVSVPLTLTIRELKDGIANGAAGYGLWVRNDLRLVYHGRILKDDDAMIGNVLNVNSERPTIHLVARPVAAGRLSIVALAESVVAPPATAALAGGPAARQASGVSPAATALTDCAHYLLFVAREHLCALLSKPTLQWELTTPPPLVPRETARDAVVSVLHAYTRQLGEGCVGVLAYESAHLAHVLWLHDGEAEIIRRVERSWRFHTGRDFSPSGEVLAIELDHIKYNLNLPALDLLTPAQLTHLLAYLQITLLVPRVLKAAQQSEPLETEPSPTPTRTTVVNPAPAPAAAPAPAPAAPAPRVVQQGSVRLRVPRFSFALVQHFAWSALRLGAFVWMLTRHMAWQDKRLWGLVACATGWLLVDAYNRWIMEDREERIRQQRRLRRAAGAGGVDGAGEGAPGGGVGHDLDDPVEAAAAARAAGVRPRNPAQPQQVEEWSQYTALYHLDIDSRQLRLPSSAIDVPRTVAGPPGTAPPGPMLRRAPLTGPGWWTTRLLLPIYLWVVTLFPMLEIRRGRAIRRRERVMRQIVHQLTPVPSAEGNENGGELATSHVDTATQPVPGEPVFPDGISLAARRYYARVARSAESIDWDEEREAQRAMGVADED